MGARLETSIAILNGFLGDYLAKTRNGLATDMVLLDAANGRGGGVPVASLPHGASLTILVHGLMCTESVWLMPDGQDYGTLLARDTGTRPVYARYNTGLPITESGGQLARAVEGLCARHPQGDITFIGHSMGGLVIRNACHEAEVADRPWLRRVRRAVYLGTPHLGAPLERVGRIVTKLLRSIPDPYTRLAGELGDLRSTGIKDLGDGLRDAARHAPLSPKMEHYLVAGTLSSDPVMTAILGDALVPTSSATHGGPARSLLPADHVRVFEGSHHMALARDASVYACIREWCTEGAQRV
jgi:pimeloyl-ACP methyl ester carboxylesterase